MRTHKLMSLLFSVLLLSGCGSRVEQEISVPTPTEEVAVTEAPAIAETPVLAESEEVGTMTVTIGDQSYMLVLETNDTAEAFLALAPMTLEMQELNGNEKYSYLDAVLPSSPQSIGEIHAGDLMLFGNSCVVLFYESFTTSYSYTPIGHLENADSLPDAVGDGAIQIVFQ